MLDGGTMPDLMPGSVTVHRTARGETRYRARLTINGKLESLGLHDTPEAASRAIDVELERQGGHVRGLTLATWGATWLDAREAAKVDGQKLHRAIRTERSLWGRHISTAPFFHWPLRKVARKDIKAWVLELLQTTAVTVKHSPRTRETTLTETGRTLSRSLVKQALALLRRCLADAADLDKVPGNVALGVTVPRAGSSKDSWTYLDADEIAAVLAAAHPGAQLSAVTVAIYQGLRQGELWGLRWKDVRLDGERPELVIRHSFNGPTKSGKVRRIPLLKPALDALKAWRKASSAIGGALVWPAHGGGCHAKGYDCGWAALKKRAGITRKGVKFHSLRHTCASHLVMGTWGRAWMLQQVREILGHSSVTTTERYAHLAPEGLHVLAAETARDGADVKRGGKR